MKTQKGFVLESVSDPSEYEVKKMKSQKEQLHQEMKHFVLELEAMKSLKESR
jgi:hypothetical protein